jgi:hypothetical protein
MGSSDDSTLTSRSRAANARPLQPGQTRFRQVEIALNTPKSCVVNYVLIAQGDNRSPLRVQRFLLKSLKLRTCNLAAAIVRAVGAKLQLLESVIVFGP